MMKMKTLRRFLLLTPLALLLVRGPVGAAPAPAGDRQQVTAVVQKGLTFLRRTQQSDGSWQRYPGISAICALAFLRNGVTEKDPAVARACAYLASLAKPNGSIYTDQFGPAQALPNYNTSLSLAALSAAHDKKFAPLIAKAQGFLS